LQSIQYVYALQSTVMIGGVMLVSEITVIVGADRHMDLNDYVRKVAQVREQCC
jgi:hypothetical protein